MNERPIKLLLVEDEVGYAYLLQAVLTNLASSRFEITHVKDLRETLARVGAVIPDVVLLDLSLPDKKGIATYQEVKAAIPALPIIVLTGVDDESLAIQAMREGAQDYLVKGQVDGKMLSRVVRYAIERNAADAERKASVGILREALSDLKKSHEELKATQLQLVQAERLEAISTFAAGVAHEVKNPLQTLTLGLDYLANHAPPGDEQAATVLREMDEAVQRADTIIRGLVEFSSYKKRAPQDEDLSAIMQQALRAVQGELGNYPIHLVTEFDERLPALRMDFKTMKHVFINLFMTSIAAMAGGGTLAVRTYVDAFRSGEDKPRYTQFKDGDQVIVAEVKDTSPSPLEGIATATPNPTLPVRPGSGLAYTVVRKIVELYGGILEVAEQSSCGATTRLLFKAPV